MTAPWLSARPLRAAAALLLLAAGLLAGCELASRPGPGEVACSCEGEARPVDPTLLSFLSKARASHQKADLAEEQGDHAQVIATLDALVRGPHPTRRTEVDEVLADARARLAEHRAALGQFDQATHDIQQGLELAREPTYFRGHLFEVLGLVEEQRASSLAADPAAAAAARQRAVRASEQAIEIQDQVIRRSLDKATP